MPKKRPARPAPIEAKARAHAEGMFAACRELQARPRRTAQRLRNFLALEPGNLRLILDIPQSAFDTARKILNEKQFQVRRNPVLESALALRTRDDVETMLVESGMAPREARERSVAIVTNAGFPPPIKPRDAKRWAAEDSFNRWAARLGRFARKIENVAGLANSAVPDDIAKAFDLPRVVRDGIEDRIHAGNVTVDSLAVFLAAWSLGVSERTVRRASQRVREARTESL